MAGYHRGIFLINKKFQLKFAFYVCAWLAALSFVYPVIIYNLFEFFIRLGLKTNATAAGIPAMQSEVIWLLVLFQTILLALTFFISIFISHRIAGPLYKLGKYFAEAANGHLHDDLLFRKKDHFKELADEFNIMMRSIRHGTEKKTDAILTVLPKLEKLSQNTTPEVKSEIDAVLAVLREARD